MNQMGGAAACLACIICAFLTIGLIAPLMSVVEVGGVKQYTGVYYGFIKSDGSSTIDETYHYDNCDSDYYAVEIGRGSWACWFEWAYILSLFFAVVSLCSTI